MLKSLLHSRRGHFTATVAASNRLLLREQLNCGSNLNLHRINSSSRCSNSTTMIPSVASAVVDTRKGFSCSRRGALALGGFGLLSRTQPLLGIKGGWHQAGYDKDGIMGGGGAEDFIHERQRYRHEHMDYARASRRREQLEAQRVEAAETFVPPVEPTRDDAIALYKALLKAGRERLRLTDKEYFRRKLRHEFEVTARQTSARVRGVMFEKGQWMLRHDLGGLR